MFIIEDRNCKWTDRSWGWTVVLYILLFQVTGLTMHIRYNPFHDKAERAKRAGDKKKSPPMPTPR